MQRIRVMGPSPCYYYTAFPVICFPIWRDIKKAFRRTSPLYLGLHSGMETKFFLISACGTWMTLDFPITELIYFAIVFSWAYGIRLTFCPNNKHTNCTQLHKNYKATTITHRAFCNVSFWVNKCWYIINLSPGPW